MVDGPLACSIYMWEGARGAPTLAAPHTLAALLPPGRRSLPALRTVLAHRRTAFPSPAHVDSVEALLLLRFRMATGRGGPGERLPSPICCPHPGLEIIIGGESLPRPRPRRFPDPHQGPVGINHPVRKSTNLIN